MSTRLEAALQVLDRLVKSGWEFPDATTYVVREHRVDLDKLRAAYGQLVEDEARMAANRPQQLEQCCCEATTPETRLVPGIRLW